MLIAAVTMTAAAMYDFECMMNSLWLEWEADHGTGRIRRQVTSPVKRWINARR